jgi:hypothetical protein
MAYVCKIQGTCSFVYLHTSHTQCIHVFCKCLHTYTCRTYIHIHIHAQVSQDEIEAARVEREVSAGVRRAKQQTMAARKEFDNLNKGYAQQMQRYLTGNSAVGDVNKVIDSHSEFRMFLHVYTYVCIYIYIHICIYIHVCMYVCMYIYIHIHTYMYIHMYIYIYICACV